MGLISTPFGSSALRVEYLSPHAALAPLGTERHGLADRDTRGSSARGGRPRRQGQRYAPGKDRAALGL